MTPIDSPDTSPQVTAADGWSEIGTIVAAQGIKGEMRVLSTSDFPERFLKPGDRWLQDPKALNPPQLVRLLRGRSVPGKNLYIIRLEEVSDRTRAESLKNYRLLVPNSDRPQLDEDEYHVSDLIGLPVYHQQTQEKIGVAIDVITAGNDLIEVRLEPSDSAAETANKTVLVPFVKEIVPVVDLATKRIELLPPPGLLELAEPEGS